MSFVVSVEKLTITLPAGAQTAQAALTKSQLTANVVPFVTTRATASGGSNVWNQLSLDYYISGQNIVVATNDFATRALVVEVMAIEVDPAKVRVQQGTFQILDASLSGTAALAQAVTLANTFLVYANQNTTTSNDAAKSAIRGRFSSNAQLTFERGVSGGQVDGHYFVVESLAGDFTVQAFDHTFADGVKLATATFPTPVVTAKTFLVSSYMGDSTIGRYTSNCAYVRLLSTTQIEMKRYRASSLLTFTTFIVSFDAATAETVQRGVLFQATRTASETVAITAVNEPTAMGWLGLSMSFRRVAFNGSDTLDTFDSMVAVDFASASLLRLQHSVFGPAASDNLSWEVVEWDAQAAVPSTRRVMVVT